jgi:hypothetical protein
MFTFKNVKSTIFWDVTPMFRINMSPQLGLLRSTRRYNPQAHTLHVQRREELKSPTFKKLFLVRGIIRS